MSVTSEIQAAARAIRRQQAPDATFHHAVGRLLDQIALTTPTAVIESQASPIVRLGLAIARAYLDPAAGTIGRQLRAHLAAEHAVNVPLPEEEALWLHRRDHTGPQASFPHDQPAHLHTWVGEAAEPAKAVAR